jgi:uncharacterized membrane protein YsdA (DUF1294 family)
MLLKIVLVIYAAMSVVTFVAYGLDKRRAACGGRRIPEKNLHLMELSCGWPGALVGQNIFRHKRRKGSFMLVFALIVLVHAAAWYGAWHFKA